MSGRWNDSPFWTLVPRCLIEDGQLLAIPPSWRVYGRDVLNDAWVVGSREFYPVWWLWCRRWKPVGWLVAWGVLELAEGDYYRNARPADWPGRS